jgi:spoIIIJ-associated protein
MKVDIAQQLVEKVLQQGGFGYDTVSIEERTTGEYYINIATADAVGLIGHNGEILLALQHVIKNIFRNQSTIEENDHVKIDVGSYRMNQEKNVTDMADRKAQQVMTSAHPASLPPMSSFFRRLVHVYIKEKYPTLTTFSEGGGNYRSVVIALSNNEEIPESADLYHDLDL